MSQDQLAHRVGRSPGWLLAVENGRADPGYGDLVRLANALKVDLAMLVLDRRAEAPKPQRGAMAVQGAGMMEEHALPTVGDERSEELRRRGFLLAALQAAFAGVGIDPDRFAAVLAGTRVDERALDDAELVTLDLMRRRGSVSPASLLPAVRGHLGGLCDVLVWTPPGLARRAYSLAGQTALLGGSLHHLQDDYAQADIYWSLADRLAAEAGDIRLRTALLEWRAARWTHAGDVNPPLALELMDQAAALLGSNPEPMIAALVYSTRACCHAEASGAQPASASSAMHDVDSIETHLSRMTAAESRVYAIESVRNEALQARALSLVYLGRSQEALVDLSEALASVGEDSASRRAAITRDIAAAHAAMGEKEHAADLLSTSLQLAAQAATPRRVSQVRWVRQQWLGGHDGPALRALDEQLRSLPVATSG